VEAKGRRIAQLQVALAEEEWILAAVVEEELLLQAEVVVANNSEKIRIGFNWFLNLKIAKYSPDPAEQLQLVGL